MLKIKVNFFGYDTKNTKINFYFSKNTKEQTKWNSPLSIIKTMCPFIEASVLM